ncbi:MAG: ethanolamine ammonia-lyase subunit EutC [Lacunisphaera sp.]
MNSDSTENSAPAALQNDPWVRLRRHTSARLALGRSGGSLPTGAVLAFAHDHALARDAVHAPFDAEALARKLAPFAGPVAILISAAPDRATYLRHPELGRRLSAESASQLSALGSQPHHDLVVVVSDGLSALAAERQAPPLLAALLPQLQAAGFARIDVVIARLGRVALQDEIGARLGARQSLMLLGERPGLGTPDSLGAYLTYEPRPGRTDAERNCVSNIHGAGLSAEAAAERIATLLIASRDKQASGLALDQARQLGEAE